MAAFRINYSRVISQANAMNDLSRDMSKEISKLEAMLSSIKSDWKGPASDAYQKQLMHLISSMYKTQKRMSGVSSTIKRVANRIQREDERAAERAKKLK